MATMSDGGNVVNLFEPDISVGDVLVAAAAKGLDTVLVLGETAEGSLYVAASGDVSRKDALWLIEMAKVYAILGDDDE
jgi:hypothetical protein